MTSLVAIGTWLCRKWKISWREDRCKARILSPVIDCEPAFKACQCVCGDMAASKALHLVVVAQYAYTDYHFLQMAELVAHRLRGRYQPHQIFGLQFFTVWCQVLQQGYFLARLIEDVWGGHRWTNFLSVLFAGAVLPSSALVVVNYWSLAWLDPRLVDDQGLASELVPAWLNHVVHSNVAAICLLELVLNRRLRYPRRRLGMAAFSACVTAYLAVCVVTLTCGDFWNYPFYRMMSTSHKITFFIYNYVVGSVVYLAGETLCSLLRGYPEHFLGAVHTDRQQDGVRAVGGIMEPRQVVQGDQEVCPTPIQGVMLCNQPECMS